MSGLKPIFEPTSVAVIGASNNPKKFGHIILKNILDSGFGEDCSDQPQRERDLGTIVHGFPCESDGGC